MTKERLAVDGAQRLELGAIFEAQAADALRQRGLRVEKFGQALLSEDVRSVLKTTNSLLRWLPDLVAWRPARPQPFLVDAKSCIRKNTPNHSIELRVLLAAHFTDLPVFFICDDYRALRSADVWPDGCILRTCCEACLAKAKADPTGRALPRHCPEHKARGGRGSGTPYALIGRANCHPLDDYFGPRRCGTCDQPETKWQATHPLYRDGATQCPYCLEADATLPGPAVADPWSDVVVRRPPDWTET